MAMKEGKGRRGAGLARAVARRLPSGQQGLAVQAGEVTPWAGGASGVPGVARILLAGLLLLGALPASAQEAPLRLSVGEAVERALEGDETVRLAAARRDLAGAQVVQARSEALPRLSGSVGYNRTLASIFDGFSLGGGGENGEEPGNGGGDEGEDFQLPFGQRNAWTAALSISQPLFSRRIGGALRVAREVRQVAELGVQDARVAVAYETRSAYFQVLLAREFLAIARESHALASAQLDEVVLQRQQGVVSDFEELQARVERDNLEPTVLEAENGLRLAELQLRRLVGVAPEAPMELTTPLSTELVDVDREALREVVLQRPALQALDRTVEARRQAIGIASAGRIPSVTGVANFGYQAFPGQFTPFDADWRRDWSLGFQVSVPVFDGLQTRGAIEQARAELLQAELERSRARSGAVLELESALADLDGALARSRARRSTVDQARRALELAELRFSSGLATTLDVSSTRLLLEQARVNEVQALHDYINALARLERVTGGIVPLLDARLSGGN